MQRDVLMEAGHRCAIPTCRMSPTEFAHIEPYSRVQEHAFDNLIALCPTCHARYDRGEIDRLSMLGYKRNLSVLSNRYGDLERRLLEAFGEAIEHNPEMPPLTIALVIPGGLQLLHRYLVRDGLIVQQPMNTINVAGIAASEACRLTPKGLQFVRRWFAAEPVDG